MKTLISLVLFATMLISGYVQERFGQDNPVPPSSEQPTVDVSPSPEVTPQVPPAVTATPEPAPEITPEPTPTPDLHDYTQPVAQSEPVDDAWFADAVLIGDSRTDGLRLYSGIRGVDFLCYKGLTVSDVMSDKPVIQMADGKIGVLQALAQKQYGKVYLSLGLNELGYNDDPLFRDTYRAVVDKIRELQPDADIYLQMIIPVSTQRCQETNQPAYISNQQVAVYNDMIRAIAAEKRVYLLNVGEIYTDENGELIYELTSDGVHFRKSGYKQWYEYLKAHTVREDAQ